MRSITLTGLSGTSTQEACGLQHFSEPRQVPHLPPPPQTQPPPATGYARALRYHLSTSLAPEEYEALNWVKAGATNIRYQVAMLA